MDASLVCPSMAIDIIVEGRQQVIMMDHRTILKKLMETLGSEHPPMYKVYECGTQGVRVSIKLNVSAGSKYFGQNQHVVEVEGETSITRMEAENSALMKALEYLTTNHMIKLRDFSRRMVDDLDIGSTLESLTDGKWLLWILLEKWEMLMQKCENTSVQLAENQASSKLVDYFGLPSYIFGSMQEHLKMQMDYYNNKMKQAKTKIDQIDSESRSFSNNRMEKAQEDLRKGYHHDVYLNAKELLAYVLTYIGAANPTYTNGPDDKGMYDGIVKLKILDVPGLDNCGKIRIISKGANSRLAEEEAAFKALVYMEKEYNMKIGHVYHQERVQAENEKRILVHLLDELLLVGDEMKETRRRMVGSMCSDRNDAVDDEAKAVVTEATKDELEAYKICATSMKDLAKHWSQCYEGSAASFEELDRLKVKLNDWKVKIGMVRSS